MGITQVNITGNSEKNALDLTVTVENLLDIRVSSGSFKIAGEDYTLSSDDVVTITVDSSEITDVQGLLVKNISTGNVEVLVDEYLLDGIDTPFVFAGSGYKLLERLYYVRVPAGTTDLSGLDLSVKRIVEPV